MDTTTTIQSLLQCDGSAHSVTVALIPSERRLIASAPDLLEALIPFAALCDEVQQVAASCGVEPDGVAKSCSWKHLVAARAAIAKAKGETP